MEYVSLGKTGLKVSAIGLGAWQFGDADWGWGRTVTEADALQIIRRAHELGVNFIDTAEVYGNGISEQVVGKAVREDRDAFVIATKVSGQHLRYADVLKAVDGSLRRLGIRQIDLYQIHWPSSYVPLSETMKALDKLVQDGRVRYVGVSNFSLPVLRQAHSLLDVASNQMRYNLLQREVEAELLPYMDRQKMTLIAYSPLAQGLLTGKYKGAKVPDDGIRRSNPLFVNPANREHAQRLVALLARIGRAHDRTPSQVTLRWLIQKDTLPIPGAKSVQQLEENVGAVDWQLTPSEFDEINRVSQACRLSYF